MTREFSAQDEIAWSRFVGATYGVVIEPRNFYVESRTGYVYVGSEYVAKVGKDNNPENAINFTDAINTLNHGTFKKETPKPKKSNVDEVIELYSQDPFVSHHWYGKMIEEAAALDDLEEDRMTAAEFESLMKGE